MLFVSNLDDRRANSRLGIEMVSLPRFIDQKSLQFGFALVGLKLVQTDPLEFHRPILVNDRHKLSVSDLNRRTQNLMPCDDDVECLLQRV